MRIVVSNIAASSGGALSILKSFYQHLTESDAGKKHEWIFLLGDKYIEETENIKVVILDNIKKSWLSRLKFDLFSGKKIISDLNPDVVFSMQNTITFGLKCRQVLYMHQSIPFQRIKKFSFLKTEERILAVYQYIIGYIIKKSIKKSDMTIVQTKWIRDAVLEFTNVSSQKIISIFPPQVDCSKYKKDNLFDKNSFFYPAASIIYKNHKCIYEACDILENEGIAGYNVSLTINESTSNSNIRSLGNIPYKSVMEMYNSSTLIFPSYIETFGLPLQEARQMGAIILASDCPFAREILDDYKNAYFFDPFNSNELARLMKNVIEGIIEKKEVNYQFKKNDNSWNKVLDVILEEVN